MSWIQRCTGNHQVLAVVGLLVGLTSVTCIEASGLTLERAEELALASDPGVRAVEANRLALEEKSVAAEQLPDPLLKMGLVALPFAFRLGRRGALYGIGVGIMLGMVFVAAIAFGEVLGETGTLPPLLAVWSPAIAFALVSVYAFLGVET